MEKICEANGIKDKIAIRTVINECEGDIRRLDRNYLKAETMKHLKKYSKSLKAA
jgi:hypothetical protein